jgi:16S rRNA U516 pseudouridylate synthase RsuA-like enzyme
LLRVAIGRCTLGELPSGAYRILDAQEVLLLTSKGEGQEEINP